MANYYAAIYPVKPKESERAMTVFPSKGDWEHAMATSERLGEAPADWIELEYIDFVGPQGEGQQR